MVRVGYDYAYGDCVNMVIEKSKKMPMSEPEYCTAITYPQTLETPEEYCENEAVEGEEFCFVHLGAEPDPDDEGAWDLDFHWENWDH